MTQSLKGDPKGSVYLSEDQYQSIQTRSQPAVIDTSLEEEKEARRLFHEKTVEITKQWPNSIENQRKARLNRLKEVADEKEAQQQILDEEERQFQEQKRLKLLEEADKKGMAKRPEIRDVNSKLLMEEVVRQRNFQILTKESDYLKRQRQKYEEDQNLLGSLNDAKIRENQLKQEKKQKEAQYKSLLFQQRLKEEESKDKQREKDVEEEKQLSRAYSIQDKIDMLGKSKKREAAQSLILGLKQQAEVNSIYQAKRKAIEDRETKKNLSINMAKEEEKIRLEEERKQKMESKRGAYEKVYEIQARTLKEIQDSKQGFDLAMGAMQFEKEKAEIEAAQAKKERLQQERRRDFLESLRVSQEKEKEKKIRREFPLEPEPTRDFYLEKSKMQRANSEYLKHQMLEKKRREAADKERGRLEFQRSYDDETKRLEEAKAYANKMMATLAVPE